MRSNRVASCLLLVLLGCSQDPQADGDASDSSMSTIHVAAAANLQFAFDEIESAFEEQHPDIQLEMTYGSSGNFYAQLTQEAPFDIFFSADEVYPRKLIDEGFAGEDSYFPYAIGQICVWVPNDSSLDLEAVGMNAVIDPSIVKIAIANPDVAPYGAAAVEAMQSLGVYDAAQDRLVLGDNISQTAQFVQFGAADVGIIALSLALAPELSDEGVYWIVPDDAYQPIVQAGVIPSASEHREEADELRQFVLGTEGQEILSQFGYLPPEE